MPWKETEAMDERMKMLAQYMSEGESISELARCYGVSRKTVYKWIERYERCGPGGLEILLPMFLNVQEALARCSRHGPA